MHKKLEQVEFGLGQVDHGLVPGYPARQGIENQIVEFDCGPVAAGDTGSTEQGTEASEEFVECIWLDEVVVGARIEPRNAISNFMSSGEHQHGDMDALVADPSAHGVAIDTWHHDIEHDGVGFVGAQQFECFATIGCREYGVTLELQRTLKR